MARIITATLSRETESRAEGKLFHLSHVSTTWWTANADLTRLYRGKATN
jgi:hypothetical protein